MSELSSLHGSKSPDPRRCSTQMSAPFHPEEEEKEEEEEQMKEGRLCMNYSSHKLLPGRPALPPPPPLFSHEALLNFSISPGSPLPTFHPETVSLCVSLRISRNFWTHFHWMGQRAPEPAAVPRFK